MSSYEAPTCVVCLHELTSKLTAAKCGHVFHRECIESSLNNSVKSCPLCRERLLPSRLVNLSFSLTPANPFADLTPQEAQDLELLQNRALQADLRAKEANRNSEKLQTELNSKVSIIKNLEAKVTQTLSAVEDLKSNLQTEMNTRKRLEYDTIKYKELFSKAHKNLKEAQSTASKLEGYSKIIKELEKKETTLTWANYLREAVTFEEQASQFYSALLAQAGTIKEKEKTIKELNSLLQERDTTISQNRKQLSLLNKQLKTLREEEPKIGFKRSAEFNLISDISNNNQPKRFKRAPSLLDKFGNQNM